MSDCSSRADNGNSDDLRVVGLFAVLTAGCIGALFPFIVKGRLESIFLLAKAFGTGVVLATGFVHVLADAEALLTDPCANMPEYPLAFAIALSAVISAFMVEKITGKFMLSTLADSNTKELDSIMELGENRTSEQYSEEQQARIVSITLEIGVVFHSVIIGLDLGSNTDVALVRNLVIVLVFHQFFEGVAVGNIFLDSKYSMHKSALLIFLFAVSAPVGTALGIAASAAFASSLRNTLIVQGVLNAFSAGLLIYVGLADMLVPLFDATGSHMTHCFIALVCGAFCMSLLAVWA
jgi:zinc transporter 1/2/3